LHYVRAGIILAKCWVIPFDALRKRTHVMALPYRAYACVFLSGVARFYSTVLIVCAQPSHDMESDFSQL
jgi:hypothetical protein